MALPPLFAGVNDTVNDPVAAVVFCAPTGARHTVVNGRLIVDGGELKTLDLPPVIAEHNRNAARLATVSA